MKAFFKTHRLMLIAPIAMLSCSQDHDSKKIVNSLIGRWQRSISSHPTVINETYNFQSDAYGVYQKFKKSKSK